MICREVWKEKSEESDLKGEILYLKKVIMVLVGSSKQWRLEIEPRFEKAVQLYTAAGAQTYTVHNVNHIVTLRQYSDNTHQSITPSV